MAFLPSAGIVMCSGFSGETDMLLDRQSSVREPDMGTGRYSRPTLSMPKESRKPVSSGWSSLSL